MASNAGQTEDLISTALTAITLSIGECRRKTQSAA